MRRNALRLDSVAVAAVTLAGAGCLSSSYRIPTDEARRLVMVAPEVRGARLRVVQRTVFSTDPTVVAGPAPGSLAAVDAPVDGDDGLVDVDFGASGGRGGPPGGTGGHGRAYPPGGQPLPAPWGPRPSGGAPAIGHAVAPSGSPGRWPASPPAGSRSGLPGLSPAGAGHRGVSLPRLDVAGDKGAAVLLVAAAAAITVALVATEGARHDGWASAPPDQPVHLLRADGSEEVRPLHALAPADLAGAPELVLDERDGGLRLGARAPLDRHGFVWRFEGGSFGRVLPDGGAISGPGAQVSVGYFPHQRAGLLAFGQISGGADDRGDGLGGRVGLEGDVVPLRLGRAHLGAFGQAGLASGEIDGGALGPRRWSASFFGGGLLGELDLTTRLALVARAGTTVEASPSGPAPALALTMGVSVY